MAPESPRRKPRERRHHDERRTQHTRSPRKAKIESSSSQSGSQTLSANALAKLDQLNQERVREQEVTPKKTRRRRQETDEEILVIEKRRKHKRKKRRVVSGALLEEGDGPALRGLRGGDRYHEKDNYDDGRRRKLCRCLAEYHGAHTDDLP